MKLYRTIYIMQDEELGHGEWHTEEDRAQEDAFNWVDPEEMLDAYDRGFFIEEIGL